MSLKLNGELHRIIMPVCVALSLSLVYILLTVRPYFNLYQLKVYCHNRCLVNLMFLLLSKCRQSSKMTVKCLSCILNGEKNYYYNFQFNLSLYSFTLDLTWFISLFAVVLLCVCRIHVVSSQCIIIVVMSLSLQFSYWFFFCECDSVCVYTNLYR